MRLCRWCGRGVVHTPILGCVHDVTRIRSCASQATTAEPVPVRRLPKPVVT